MVSNQWSLCGSTAHYEGRRVLDDARDSTARAAASIGADAVLLVTGLTGFSGHLRSVCVLFVFYKMKNQFKQTVHVQKSCQT